MKNLNMETLEMLERLQANGRELQKEMKKRERMFSRIDKQFKKVFKKLLTFNQ